MAQSMGDSYICAAAKQETSYNIKNTKIDSIYKIYWSTIDIFD